MQINQYYDENMDYEEYYQSQIIRHRNKMNKMRISSHYKLCADLFKDLVKDNSSMVCLGTRNNHERDCFIHEFSDKNIKVYSLDIAPASQADFIMDFSDMPEEWNNKWDIVFSNAIDNAPDAGKAFKSWLKIIKSNGLLILGLGEGGNVTKADCCVFSKDNVDTFLKLFNNIDVLNDGEIIHGYFYYIIKKVNDG